MICEYDQFVFGGQFHVGLALIPSEKPDLAARSDKTEDQNVVLLFIRDLFIVKSVIDGADDVGNAGAFSVPLVIRL